MTSTPSASHLRPVPDPEVRASVRNARPAEHLDSRPAIFSGVTAPGAGERCLALVILRFENKGTGSRRRRGSFIFGAAVLLEPVAMKPRGYRLGGNLVVRCREGHLFTTIWIQGISLKSLRFAWWRFQRCPVGKHWSIVTPVKESVLTGAERRTASEHRDIRVPRPATWGGTRRQ
jgi:hypothetical protein